MLKFKGDFIAQIKNSLCDVVKSGNDYAYCTFSDSGVITYRVCPSANVKTDYDNWNLIYPVILIRDYGANELIGSEDTLTKISLPFFEIDDLAVEVTSDDYNVIVIELIFPTPEQNI